MAAPTAPRATLDFFGAQANARRRTALLVVSFTLAVAGVIAVVYGALAVALVGSGAADLAVAAGAPPLVQPALLAATTAGVLAVTGLGATYHAVRLSAGGGEAVAQMLGGVPVDRGTGDPALRRLVNVAEELSIAAGMPVPHLFVLERESRINALAAGYTPGHCAIAVTRGALDKLDRAELQGVVAHELSHVLNADTRIDLRLLAAVGGLGVLALVGRFLLRNSRWSSDEGKGVGGFLFLGLALLVAGSLGAFFGRLVRFAVARQREWLADASSVQFTRNPDGLAGALRKIGAEGSAISSPYAPEAAHLFFASGSSGFLSEAFSTHPPLEERILRLAPYAAASRRTGPGAPPPPAAPPPAAPAPGLAAAAPLAGLGAPPAPEHVERAAEILGNLPPALREAAREPFGARAVVCALLLDAAPAVRQRQTADLAADPALAAEVARLAPLADGVPAAERMSLLMMALPPLDHLSPAQAADLAARISALAAASGMATPFVWAAQRVARRRLARSPGAPPRVRLRNLGDAEPECHVLLSTLAWVGGRDQAQAQAALDAGVRSLGLAGPWRILPRDRTGPGPLDAALSRLDEAPPALKVRALAACVATAAADARVSPGEAEVIRAVSASFGLPMPPLLQGP